MGHLRWGMRRSVVVVATAVAAAAISTACAQQRATERAGEAVLTPGDAPGVHYVAIVGDAETSGSAMGGIGADGWPRLAVADLQSAGMDIEATVNADGRSGYVVGVGARQRDFEDRVRRSVSARTDLAVVFGSRNDEYAVEPPSDPARLASAVEQTVARIRAVAPTAAVLLIGPSWTGWADGEPPAARVTVRDVIRDVAAARDVTFLDPIADRWFAGRPDLVGVDGVNATDAGHRYMASLVEPVIGELLGAENRG